MVVTSSITSVDQPPSKKQGKRAARYVMLVLFAFMISFVIVSLLVILTLGDGRMGTDKGAVFADIRTLEVNLVRYRTMVGDFPSQDQGLEVMTGELTGPVRPKCARKLMEPAALIDPWGHPYQYRLPGKRKPDGFDVYSWGPDGQEGTPDDVYSK